jgi:hypothetical protein
MAVPWLRRLVAGMSLRRPGFALESVCVGFVLGKVALGQVSLRVFRFTLSLSFHRGCPYSCITLGMKNRPVSGRSSDTFTPSTWTTTLFVSDFYLKDFILILCLYSHGHYYLYWCKTMNNYEDDSLLGYGAVYFRILGQYVSLKRRSTSPPWVPEISYVDN